MTRLFKIVLLICLTIVILTSCNNNRNYSTLHVDKENNGYSTITLNNKGDTVHILQYNKDSLLDGYVKKYYENGDIRSISRFKDGELHGPEVVYFPDGDTQYTMVYEEGKKDGILNVYWDESGKLKYQIWYLDDIQFGSTVIFDEESVLDSTNFFALEGLYGRILHQNDSAKIFGEIVYSIYNKTKLHPKDTFTTRTWIASPPGWNVEIDTEFNSNSKGRVIMNDEKLFANTKILSFRYTTDSVGVFDLTHNITIKNNDKIVYLDTVKFKLNYMRE